MTNIFFLKITECRKLMKVGAKIVIRHKIPIRVIKPYLHLKLNNTMLMISRSLMRTSGNRQVTSFNFFPRLGSGSSF